MLIRRSGVIPSSEVTDEPTYLRRREFLGLAGGSAIAVAAAPWLAGCSGVSSAAERQGGGGLSSAAQTPLSGYKPRAVATDEKLNTFDEITGYNNFYEFGTGKSDPRRYAGSLHTSPWTVRIDGHCSKPANYQVEDLIKPLALEERIYRLRCVEAWSMVIPWIGVPLADVLRRAGPTSKATF
ncbi:MAG: molybdopterin-dependent oxidoreductase, partial [Acidobacteriota bacterium]